MRLRTESVIVLSLSRSTIDRYEAKFITNEGKLSTHIKIEYFYVTALVYG